MKSLQIIAKIRRAFYMPHILNGVSADRRKDPQSFPHATFLNRFLNSLHLFAKIRSDCS